MTRSKHLRLFRECGNARGTSLHRAQIPPATLGLHMGAHELRAVGLQTVSDDQQLLADRRPQGFKKFDDLGALDRAVEQAKVESPIGDSGNHRQPLPAEAELRHRRLTLRSPRSRATRSLGLTRLVYDDNYAALSRSDFFNAGHLLAFQVRIARSSRSRAWPLGRCTLQPSRPRSRHTEEGTIETENLSSINRAIRGNVHSSVAKPAASDRAFSNRTSTSRCDSDSRSGRPKCSARRSASSPPCWRSLSQRVTVWRETPTCRATSACACPAASSLAPRRRRRSSSLRFSECVIGTPNVTIPGTWTARCAKSVTHVRISQ